MIRRVEQLLSTEFSLELLSYDELEMCEPEQSCLLLLRVSLPSCSRSKLSSLRTRIKTTMKRNGYAVSVDFVDPLIEDMADLFGEQNVYFGGCGD